MRKAAAAALLMFAFSAMAMPPVPRKAPELTVQEPSGKQTLISSMKGKVVVIQFLYTTCPHCQATAQAFTKLQKEMGARGVQFFGVAFNDNAAVLVPPFVQQYGIGFPVGSASSDTVMSYLGFSVMDRYVVPQEVVIDKKGMIRAQSGPQGDERLQDPSSLRNLLDSLLKEGATTTTTSKASAPPKS
ncbi:MAG: TlpA disulfide reductase family protein [Bryobacteraceae bacterium]|jgi:peroxiredoxin